MNEWMTREEYKYREQRERNLKREKMTREELKYRYRLFRQRKAHLIPANHNMIAQEAFDLLSLAMHQLDELPLVHQYTTETNNSNDLVTGDIKMAANPKNKFYVGRPTLLSNNDSGYCKATEKEAIEHARALVEETGVTQVVVKMVAIVERQKPPVKITRVK